MRTIGDTALWLAAVLGAWVIATAVAGGRRDERLARSGGRALHAVPVLLLLSLVGRLVVSMAELAEAPRLLAAAIAVRELWTDPAARLALWATAVAAFAAAVPGITRRDARDVRVRAQLRAGVVSLLFIVAAAGAGVLMPGIAEEPGAAAPVAVHVPAGIAGRLLLVLGCAAMIVPLAVARAARHRSAALRWTLVSLATIAAALALLAHTHYAALAAPSVIDASGAPVAPPWTSLSALWAVPLLAVGALAYRLAAPADVPAAAMRGTGSRAASLLLVTVGALAVGAAVVPGVVAWTEARDSVPGVELRPPLLVLALLPALLAALAILVTLRRRDDGGSRRDLLAGAAGAVLLAALAGTAGVRNPGTLASLAVAGALAALLAASAARASGIGARALWTAQCAAVLAIGAGLAAISVRPEYVDAIPGTPAEVTLAGRTWRLSSQGPSQDETPAYDGVVIAFDVRSAGASRIVTTGERAYRDAHGHAATRAAVPALVRGATGDLRLVVRGTRSETARLQVQYHPLATAGWLAAAVTVVALLTAAAAPSGGITPPEEVLP